MSNHTLQMQYIAPVKEMQFVMHKLANLENILQLPTFAKTEVDLDTSSAILAEAAKFNQEIVSPLNWIGDQQPSTLQHGKVTTPPGFKEAYHQYSAAGWQGILHPRQFGGQNLPRLLNSACQEMVNSANLSFALCPLLTDGAIEALLIAASPLLQEQYLPKLVSGQWSGTMNLTEPSAGSDLANVRTRAQRQNDQSYKIFGTKIYITYGEHDLTENIIHLVLARASDAPEGVKGLSLFVVPKFLINPDHTIGERNDVHCLSIEHKLGIKASPTAVLQFGDHGGATGYLVGNENHGLEYMFIMMNAARFAVGVQGIAIAQRSYQQAVSYAKERLQSKDLVGSDGPISIIHHPDVKRLLMTMRAYTEGARSLAYFGASIKDQVPENTSFKNVSDYQSLYEYLVPIIKGFSTEMSLEVTSLGIQVHGGMGFIEDTGVAQYYRDARILTIYEGTTAIQANDLLGRKTIRDNGTVTQVIIQQIIMTEIDLEKNSSTAAQSMLSNLRLARKSYEDVLNFILKEHQQQLKNVFAGSVPYLQLAGITLAGWQMARALIIAQKNMQDDPDFYAAKITTARFFAEHLLTKVPAIARSILEGGMSANNLNIEQF